VGLRVRRVGDGVSRRNLPAAPSAGGSRATCASTLGRNAYSVGTGRGVEQGPGSLVVSVKATRKAKKALKRLKSLKATLTLVATDSAGNSSTRVSRRVTLKR
jgi:hypothetical protein